MFVHIVRRTRWPLTLFKRCSNRLLCAVKGKVTKTLCVYALDSELTDVLTEAVFNVILMSYS